MTEKEAYGLSNRINLLVKTGVISEETVKWRLKLHGAGRKAPGFRRMDERYRAISTLERWVSLLVGAGIAKTPSKARDLILRKLPNPAKFCGRLEGATASKKRWSSRLLRYTEDPNGIKQQKLRCAEENLQRAERKLQGATDSKKHWSSMLLRYAEDPDKLHYIERNFQRAERKLIRVKSDQKHWASRLQNPEIIVKEYDKKLHHIKSELQKAEMELQELIAYGSIRNALP